MDRLPKSKRIGQQLREWREACELTLDDVADELHLSQTVLVGIESGLIRTPEDLLKSFADIYEIAEEELKNFISSLIVEDSES